MLPLRVRVKHFLFTLFCLGVWGAIAWAVIAQPANSQAQDQPVMCTLLGIEGAGPNQQIRIYTGPSFEETDGSYGLPTDRVEFLEYVNAQTRGEEWFKVRFPESGYVGWIIRYHIACPESVLEQTKP